MALCENECFYITVFNGQYTSFLILQLKERFGIIVLPNNKVA